MSWISLSATSLLDTQYGYSVPISMDLSVLHAHLSDLSWYSQVQLSKNMRSTGQIGSCAAPGQVEKYSSSSAISTYTPTSVLPPLVANTVPGVRPHLTMTAWSSSPDYDAIQQGVLHSLTTLLHLPTPVTSHHVAILCGYNISPRQVATLLTSHPTTLYDAGVDYYADGTPAYYQPGESDLTTQREEVIQWLTGQGGVLVTSSHLYNGLEADFVIFVTSDLSDDRGVRSSLLRAVGGLCVVTASEYVNKKEVSKQFTIHTFPA